MSDVTSILQAIGRGEPKACEDLLPLVYDELRQLAAARIAREQPGHTLQPTALVLEAWLRLVGDEARTWKNRGYFFGAAAEAMRAQVVKCKADGTPDFGIPVADDPRPIPANGSNP